MFQFPSFHILLAIDISTIPQSKADFPTFTFCPWPYGENPSNFNMTNLAKCGLNFEDMRSGMAFGNGSQNCEDLDLFWKYVSIELSNFGLQILVIFTDGNWKELPIEEDSKIWTKVLVKDLGFCFSLNLPKDMTKQEIFNVQLLVEPEKEFRIFLHQNGLLNTLESWQTTEFTQVQVHKWHGYVFEVKYTLNQVLDFNGQPCEADPDYSYTQCLYEVPNKVKFSIFTAFRLEKYSVQFAGNP